ncbi:MAG: polysaccharide deacetylase family protein [Aquificaceae bacterium]
MLVLLYHKVLKSPSSDIWWRTFDAELYVLKKLFKVVTLDEVLEYINSQRKPEKQTVAITFDDGYADNYVYAYPLLKKHRLKATIFVTSSRIIRRSYKRKTLEDYWEGKASLKELYTPLSMHQANLEFLNNGYSEDFLTEEEIRSMLDVFDIGWHSKWHTKDFCREKVLDFYDGANGHWSLVHAYGEEPSIGLPLFPMRGSLSVKAGKLRKEIIEFVRSKEVSFFERKDWKRVLKEELSKNFSQLLDFEDLRSRTERIRQEIEESARELKEIAQKSIYHAAYPFGDYDQVLKDEVSKRFNSAFTTEKRGVSLRDDPYLLPRVSVPKDVWSFFAILLRFLKSS